MTMSFKACPTEGSFQRFAKTSCAMVSEDFHTNVILLMSPFTSPKNKPPSGGISELSVNEFTFEKILQTDLLHKG